MSTFLLTLTAPERVATAIADELADGSLRAADAPSVRLAADAPPIRLAADAAGAFDLGNGTWGVEAYFPGEVAADDLIATLTDLFATREDLSIEDLIAAISGAQLRPLEAEDWSELALDQLPPIVAGRFRIFGEHNRPLDLGRSDLVIEASTAFGTGDHASTQLALKNLDRILKIRRPRHVLDLGTGTGVLALAVAKAVPDAAIMASDIEPVAVTMTAYNAAENGLAGRLKIALADGLHHPAIRTGAPYDLVLANILPDPLSRLAPDIVGVMGAGGLLVIAGLRQGEEARMIAAYRARGLVFVAAARAKEWSSLVFAKP